ncbi:protein kinase domain-containing protein [Protofrankia symbiont of Coriaria ruscifolia]|uniref:non-specific serine/threonine protein kinase n=1 Tax=Candidatus Protofrankia californiensis TaxID=1839754 RepID=A0A1C3NSW9_9ACTN|nr:hypothetical protein FDG2_0044 [Candidatus Protofrankia californiensis]
MIHCDLKPGNIILAADGPRVIDFGISRAVEASSTRLTQAGVQIGTPAFMAPEQVRGKSLETSGDIFSLGSTAYYAVTGELPFGGDAAVFHRIEHKQPDWDRCPDQIRGVLERCVEKDPAGRPTPAGLIELCRAASTDKRLRIDESWLPPTVIADLGRYNTTPPEPPQLLPTESEPPRPQLPISKSPDRSGRKRSPWLIGVLSAVVLVATIIISILLINGWLNRANDSTGPTTPDESSRNLDVTTAPAHTSGFTLHNNRFEQRMCLDADLNGHSSNGTKVQLWACNGSVQQRWDYEGDPYTTGALIRSVQWPAMCLDADTNTIGGNGTKVQLWTCNGFAQQQWQE